MGIEAVEERRGGFSITSSGLPAISDAMGEQRRVRDQELNQELRVD